MLTIAVNEETIARKVLLGLYSGNKRKCETRQCEMDVVSIEYKLAWEFPDLLILFFAKFTRIGPQVNL